MQIVLDFDRVLFDTDTFQSKLKEVGLHDVSRGRALVEAVNERGIDWTAFVRPGVSTFLRQQGNHCVVVSSYVSRYRQDNQNASADLEYFQREKIHRSGVADLVSKVVLVGESKLAALQALQRPEETAFFLDDEPEHVHAARSLGYNAILFRTPKNNAQAEAAFGEENDIVRSVTQFEEFVALIQSWKPKP
jgi:hypothetical protein